MKKSWTNGLEGDDIKEVRLAFKEAHRCRERLVAMLEDDIRQANTKKISSASYENPSWSHFQADANGYERALRHVISLLIEA